MRRARRRKKIETDLKSSPRLFVMGIKNYNVFASLTKIITKRTTKSIRDIVTRKSCHFITLVPIRSSYSLKSREGSHMFFFMTGLYWVSSFFLYSTWLGFLSSPNFFFFYFRLSLSILVPRILTSTRPRRSLIRLPRVTD